jgi:peptidoglycan/xylan/chitin deacetylase (PgdA/CDA1 family)
MEKRLAAPCPYLCWPYGSYNEASLKIAKEAGYEAVFTTDHGVVRPGSDLYRIKRIDVRDSVSWFKKRIFTYSSPVFSELYLKVRKK